METTPVKGCYIHSFLLNTNLGKGNQMICSSHLEQVKSIINEVGIGNKIKAIKLTREEFSLGLRDAKEIVEGVIPMVQQDNIKVLQEKTLQASLRRKDFVNQIIFDLLNNQEQVPFFLGGSVRWGWNTYSSDLDVFVLIEEPEHQTDYYNYHYNCKLNQFSRKYHIDRISNSDYPERGIHFRGTVFGEQIDFIVFFNKDAFEKLKSEHEVVENYLNKMDKKVHENLMFIFKNGIHSGKEKYQLILRMINEGI